jgi:hypothetical protein
MSLYMEVLFELLLQVFMELFFEFGSRSLVAPFEEMPNPWLAAVGYVLFGAVAGALSLWAFPALFIHAPMVRMINVAVTPLIAGASMAGIGAWRTARGQHTILLDRFVYGFLFALAMALVRWGLGH